MAKRSFQELIKLTPKEIQKNGESGLKNGKSRLVGKSPKDSMNSTVRSSGSNKPWQRPKNALELAAQINQVATLILNDEIDLEKSRAYGALTRNVAQLLSIEGHRARAQKREMETEL